MNTEKTKTLTKKSQNVSELLSEVRKTTTSGGILVDDIQNKLNISRTEVIEQCRALKGNVALKVGRKGHSSTLLFGRAATDFKNNHKDYQHKIAPVKSEKSPFNVARFHLGNQIVDIPIDSMELVAV